MTTNRVHLTADRLAPVAHAVFGGGRALSSVERLRGGTKKGVYRLILDDGTTGVAYVWNDDENYWPASAGKTPSGRSGESSRLDVLAPASELDLFEAAHTALSAIGVRVPKLLYLDRTARLVPGDLAVLEDVRGGSLEAMIAGDPERAEPALSRLGDAVRAMNACRGDGYGLAWSGPGDAGRSDRPVEQLVLERALGHLKASAARVDRIAAAQQRIADTLHERFAAVTARRQYGLIHSELGPDHVLLDDHDEPVLIDIEGTVFFDVEWEHAFLELRFHENYRHLAVDGLDQNRLRLYRLGMYLSLVEGPLRLLDGDFPHREVMLDIVEDNIRRTLAELA